MKNRMVDLNNHLFEQMERLNDEELSAEDLEKEVKRAHAMAQIGSVIVKNAANAIKAQALIMDKDIPMPDFLIADK